MPITQQLIADHLGISKKSVARALGGGPKVSEATRRRIQQAAQELGYHADTNPEARALAARRHGQRVRHAVIGCVHFGAEHPYWMALQNGIYRAALDAGFHLMLLPENSLRGCEKVDGVLIHSEAAFVFYQSLPLPIPYVSLMVSGQGAPSVVADEAAGIRAAVRHLVELGHRRIGFLVRHKKSGPGDWVTVSEKLRLGAYRGALRENGITPQAGWVRDLPATGEFAERGYTHMRAWLQSGWAQTGCTALLCQNDRTAVGALRALNEAGIAVPRDVSVVGFDGTSECELARPSLSSVHVPLEAIGRRATEILLEQINAPEIAESAPQIVLPTQFEARASTAPPRLES